MVTRSVPSAAHADGTDLTLTLGINLSSNQNPIVTQPEILVEGEDYYLEDGLLVMTAAYHKKRGSCCGNKCRWCPFEPRHEGGVTKLGTVQPSM
jgi:hypothetical protein